MHSFVNLVYYFAKLFGNNILLTKFLIICYSASMIKPYTKNGLSQNGGLFPTIKDIAVKAHVSIGTVSCVLNNKVGSIRISEKTRKRVLRIAEELNYRPNVLAQSLRTQKSHTIGVYLRYMVDVHTATILHHMIVEASSRNYRLVLSVLEEKINQPEVLRQVFFKGSVDGLIIIELEDIVTDTVVGTLLKDGLKVALIDRHIQGLPVISVLSDNEHGGFLVTEYLLRLGHRRIGFLSGQRGNVYKQRLSGATRAFHEKGMEMDNRLVVQVDNTNPFHLSRAGYKGGIEMLKLKPRPTAVAVFGDVFALGAMRAFQEAGLKIPDDLVLTGFDNTLSLTEYTCPPLTTVQQNTTGMGRSSIRLLLDSIEGKIHVPDEGQATFFKP